MPELDLEGQFIRTLAAIAELVGVSQDLPRSRYRNLADFYSLFAAVGDLLPEGWRPAAPIVEHMLEFARRVEMARTGETRQETDPEAHAYYEAARAASNDAGPRQARIQTLKKVLRAEG